MDMSRTQWATGLVALVVAAGLWYYVEKVHVPAFPINAADTIPSWNFKGAYSGNDALMSHANADIAKLQGLLGKGEYDDYDLSIGIGNDDTLLGDGRRAYQSYNRAAHIHQNKGLAYANLAHLMDELGAYHTAADAYAKAVATEPRQLEYHLERLTYLTRQFPSDNALILAALTDAAKEFGDTAPVLAIEAEWLAGQGRFADAIKAWQAVKMLSPGKDVSAIDVEIVRLKAKQ
ncbi:hypothetical protein HY091_03100 [Candidatus Kaiserbacteria bacterium]|nr:hypothetical protein [Candidatus Kaiserbacteria bacterium]